MSKAKEAPSTRDDFLREQFERIRKAAGSEFLTPKMVVDDARKSDSPLHGEFEWDKNKAAEKYWIAQARSLISSVSYQVILHDGSTASVRSEVSVTEEFAGNERVVVRGYLPRGKVMQSAVMKRGMIDQALGELRQWMNRYVDIAELAPQRRAIESLVGAPRKLKKVG